VRWRLVDLIAWVWEEFRLSISKQCASQGRSHHQSHIQDWNNGQA
jgi:hypothetical protein